MIGDYYLTKNSTSTPGTWFSNCDISNKSSWLTHAGNQNSCGYVLVESIPGLKIDAGLAVEWSIEEQQKLDYGFSQFLFHYKFYFKPIPFLLFSFLD